MRVEKKHRLKQLRRFRIRKKIIGTKERPRMSVCFSNQHIYVQFVDDAAGVTIASASTRGKITPKATKAAPNAANAANAKRIGTLAAEAAKSKGISRVVFDRGGMKYHGKVKALADAAREGGLQF